jgi:hypothetical protein
MARLAGDYVGAVRSFFIGLSAVFTALGIILLTRRVVFPRVLELTEEAILFPHGFPRTRVTRIAYTDIIRMFEAGSGARAALYLGTAKGSFEIWVSHLADIKSYREVRDYISARTSIAIHCWEEGQSAIEMEGPKPILRWMEPEDWPRYRTHVFLSKPLRSRMARALWFFVRCFGFFVVPWLLLRVFQVTTAPTLEFLALTLAGTLFLTLVYWIYSRWPVHSTDITVRERGITQFFGKQTWDRSYGDISGWRVIERGFEGRMLHVLLLKGGKAVSAIALPDAETRERVAEVLREKGVPEVEEVSAPWE